MEFFRIKHYFGKGFIATTFSQHHTTVKCNLLLFIADKNNLNMNLLIMYFNIQASSRLMMLHKSKLIFVKLETIN